MVIGICGLISSGKDTIADYLIKEHNFVKISFADKLKDNLADTLKKSLANKIKNQFN